MSQAHISYAKQVAYLGTAEKISAEVTRWFGERPSARTAKAIEKIAADRQSGLKSFRAHYAERKPTEKLPYNERNAAIRRDADAGVSKKELSRRYRLAPKTIGDILSGKQRA